MSQATDTAPAPAALTRIRQLLPSRNDYRYFSATWRNDLIAGVTVGVVALPLALAFGITTGLGASAGLVTAIIAGLVAAVFGGSDVQVSGPTGAMTVVLVPIVTQFGIDAVYVVSILAGLLIVLAAFAGLGRYLAFIPWPVIEGFTIGIATIILLQQFPNALGVSEPGTGNTVVVAIDSVVSGFSVPIDELLSATIAPLGVTVMVVLTMVLLPRVAPKVPASLSAIVLSTVVVDLAGIPVARIGALPDSLPVPTLPDTDLSTIVPLLSAAVSVALLAALESLLSAKVADGMVPNPPHDPDRELFGQGLANVVSPLFGGMPATGAIARTAVNVRAGARTRASSLVHALLLLVIVYFAGPLVARIPLAALAGVLVITAWRMVDRAVVGSVIRSTRSDAAVLVLTAGATIIVDLLLAVQIGVLAAAVLSLRKLAGKATATADISPLGSIESTVETPAGAANDRPTRSLAVYTIDGPVFFAAAQRLLDEILSLPPARVVILRLSQLQLLDATGAQMLGEIVEHLEEHGTTVLLKGPTESHLELLRTVGALERLAHEKHIFEDLDAAVEHANEHLARLDAE